MMEAPTQNIEADFSGLDAVQQKVQDQENLSPDLLQQIRSKATPRVKLAAIDRLMTAHQKRQTDSVLANIHLAKVLGMEGESPDGDKILTALSNFYKPKVEDVEEKAVPQVEETPEVSRQRRGPTRREFFKRTGLAGLGVVGLGATAATGILWQASRTSGQVGSVENSQGYSLPETKNEQSTVFDEFIKPFVDEALRRRKVRAEADPNYHHRVDRELTEGRVNILLKGSGKQVRIGLDPATFSANQILSINIKNRTIDLISITSETRDPNTERYYKKTRGQTPSILSINNSFETGQEYGGDVVGFDLMRESFEQATGLSMDFQMVFTDVTIRDFIDEVTGGLDVDIPYDFSTYKTVIGGKEYPDQDFKVGKRRMDGASAVQYMSAAHWEKWEKNRLPHHRKHLVLEEVIKAGKGNMSNPISGGPFLTRLAAFLNGQINKGDIKLDFDLNAVMNFGIFKDPSNITRPFGFNELRVDKSIIMMNPDMGGAGVRYVGEDRWTNPVSNKDIQDGVYPSDSGTSEWWSAVAVPYNGNPHADDLVTGYWGSTRDLVRKRLMGVD